MSNKLEFRDFLYELISAAHGLSVMGIFGILFLLPVEIQIVTITQSTFYAYLFISFAIIISYLIFTLYSEFQRIIMRFFEIISVGFAAIMCITFIIFTKNLTIPWLPQGAWFIHENGIVIGMFLGSVILKTSGALNFLFTLYHNLQENHDTQITESKFQLSSLLIIFTAFFIGFGFWIYRFTTLLAFFYSIVIFQTIFAIIGILPLLSKSKDNYSKYLVQSYIFTEDPFINAKNNPNVQITSFKGKIRNWFETNQMILDAQTWKLVKQFCGIAVTLIIAGILHMFEIKYKAFVHLEYAQIALFFALVFLFLNLSTKGFKDSSNARYGQFISNGVASQGKYAIIDNLNQFSHFGLIIVLCFVQYYYRNPMYIPEVMVKNMIFTGIGAGIYYLVYYLSIRKNEIKKIQSISLFVFIFSSILLILNIIFLYYDGIRNGVSYDGDMTLNIFPFKYLFSYINSLLVGLSTGLLLSENLHRFAFEGRDYVGAPSKSLTIILTIFIIGLLLTVFNYILVATPGALYPFENVNLFRSLSIFLILVIIFIFLCFILSEYIIPQLFFKQNMKNRNENTLKIKIKIKTPSLSKFNANFSKIKSIALGSIIIVSLFSGIGISSSHAISYQKPMIAKQNGGYFIWVEESSQIVTKTTPIAWQTSPMIEFATINLAKNEYGAIQFVFNPFNNQIDNLTYTISDFVHNSDLNAKFDNSTSSLRWVRSVIDEQYPDVLMPFTSIQANKSQNTVFWFSVRTPYHILNGTYSGNITLKFQLDDSLVTEILPIQLNIWNFTIPETRHLRTRYWRANFVTADIESFFSHRVNSDGVPISRANNLTDLETVAGFSYVLNDTTDQYIFNWTWWDNQTESFLKRGQNIFEVGMGYGFDRVPNLDDPHFQPRITNYLTQVQAHLYEKNWSQYAYIYFLDEFEMFVPKQYTREEYFTIIGTIMSWVKAAGPDIKILVTAPPEPDLVKILDQYIDIYCPVAFDYEREDWDKQVSAGKEMWIYFAVGPIGPFPNNHLYNRLYESRLLMWQMWTYNLSGNLGWAAYTNRHGAYSIGYNGYSDGVQIYWEGNNYYESIRWENLLEGIEDYEYFWILNASLNYIEKNNILPATTIELYKIQLNSLISQVAGDQWDFTHDVNDIYQNRAIVGQILNELSSYANLTLIAEQKVNWLNLSLY